MSTPEFNLDKIRNDPYASFRFRVKCAGVYVAGVSNVNGLVPTAQVVKQRSGIEHDSTHIASGHTQNAPITFERGITFDPGFARWATESWQLSNVIGEENKSSQALSPQDFRKDLVIELFSEAGEIVMAYNIYGCWVSEYQALPDLDGAGNAIAILNMTLQNEGWERDVSFD